MHQVGRGIDAARHGKSDQWIADRTKKLGHPLSRTAISEYRRGVRKTISVTDWLVIAAALGVPPVSLLFPGVPDKWVTLLPTTDTVVAFDAVQWVAGERQTIPEGFDAYFDAQTGDMVGHVEGRRDYRSPRFEYEQSHIDLRREGDPSPEFAILRASRAIMHIYAQVNEITSDTWRVMSDVPEEMQKTLLDTRAAKLKDLDEKLQELEKNIEALGGTIQDEKITQYGDGND